ncbi:MAG: HEAT repeat domain-containing protein [Gemmatimonadales bacterium]
MRLSPILHAAAGLVLLAAPLAAQDPALVEALAPILMAEDRRLLDLSAMSRAIGHPDALVRRTAVVAVGRIGDKRGAPLIVEALGDRDQAVVADAFFALGLLADSNNAAAIIARIRQPDSLDAAAAAEASAALARSGGSAAIAMLGEIIGGRGSVTAARRDLLLPIALLESWKLGAQAPVAAMLPFLNDQNDDLRWRATYTVARLKAPTAGNQLLRAARDKMPLVREAAVKAFTRAYADSAGLPAATVLGELRRALQDASPGVKISALQALGSWRDSAEVANVLRLLTDADFNVRVQATTALGELRGEAAMAALDGLFEKQGAVLGHDAASPSRRWPAATRRASPSAPPSGRPRRMCASGSRHTRVGAPSAAPATPSSRRGCRTPTRACRPSALSAWRTARPRTDTTVIAAARERLRSPAPRSACHRGRRPRTECARRGSRPAARGVADGCHRCGARCAAGGARDYGGVGAARPRGAAAIG